MYRAKSVVEEGDHDVPAVGRRRRRSREELTQVIIVAATDLFAAQGFSGPTTRDIAHAAGVPLPTMYKFFEDKRALYDACCRIALYERMETAREYVDVLEAGPKYIYNLLYLGFEIKLKDPQKRSLLDRMIFEGHVDSLSEDYPSYFESKFFKKVLESARIVSDENSAYARLIIMDAFFGHMPHIMKLWPENLRFDLHDIHGMVVQALTILFPKIDWSAVSREIGGKGPRVHRRDSG